MLDGLYILSEDGNCILTFPINGNATLNLGQFSSFVPSTPSVTEWAQTVEVTPRQLLYQRKHGNLYVCVPFDSSAVPIVVEQLTLRVIEAIELYLKARLTTILVTEHRPEIVLILSEMLDTGIPRITQPDIIRQLVYKDDFLSKLMNNASLGASSQSAVGNASNGKISGAGNMNKQEVPDALIPWEVSWRRSQVKHPKEELFVDVIEHARMVVNAKSKSKSTLSVSSLSSVVVARPTRVQLIGEIKLVSRLSGLPQVTINFSNDNSALLTNNTQLHPSVDLNKFEASNGRTVSFIPADGESVIAKYRLVAREVGPVAADLRRFDANGGDGSFQVRVSTSIDSKVEHVSDLVVFILFPEAAHFIKELSATSGDFNVSNPQRCELRFSKTVPMGWNAMLHAIATDEEGQPVSPLCIDVRYNLVGRVPSHTTVKSINISSDKIKMQAPPPFKGVRYQTVVDSYVVS